MIKDGELGILIDYVQNHKNIQNGSLPKRKEQNCLNAQKFGKRVERFQSIFCCSIKQYQEEERDSYGYIIDDSNI